MLTKSEKEWLRERKFFPLFSCVHCKNKNFYILNKTCFGTDAKSCIEFLRLIELKYDLRDAAEYEARVAARLASRVGACPYVTMPMSKHCMRTGCVACKLRDARLEVEEEMDADGQ